MAVLHEYHQTLLVSPSPPHTHAQSLICPAVMFEIELMSFIDYKAADVFSSLTPSQKREASLEQLIAAAHAEKEV